MTFIDPRHMTLPSKPSLEPKHTPKKTFSLQKKEKEPQSNKKKEPSTLEEAFLEKALILTSPFQQKSEDISSSKTIEILSSTLIEHLSHQEKQGISTTTLLLGDQSPLKVLCGTEIEIKCYDTDPTKFHIDFFSTPQGALFLSTHLTSLHERLQSSFPDTFFSLAKPLLNTYATKEKRKENYKPVSKPEKTNPFV